MSTHSCHFSYLKPTVGSDLISFLHFCLIHLRLRVPEDALIPLTQRDENKLSSLLKRPYLTCQPAWQREVRDERKIRVE